MRWYEGEDGGVGAEYAILGAVIALGFFAALAMLGVDLAELYERVSDDVIAALQ